MRLFLSNHAVRRLADRVTTRGRSHERLCWEAWASREKSETLLFLRRQNMGYRVRYRYRLFQDTVFVFREDRVRSLLTLVTCFQHLSVEDTKLYQGFNSWARH